MAGSPASYFRLERYIRLYIQSYSTVRLVRSPWLISCKFSGYHLALFTILNTSLERS